MTMLTSRIISAILSFVMSIAPFGASGAGNRGGAGGKMTVYVSASATADADGTKEKPYSSLEEARDALRDINKNGYSGIDVVVGAGVYQATDTLVFTSEDSGTADCPIRYIGEDGAVISGKITFSSDAFVKCDGEELDYFYSEVRDNIVKTDLKKFGFTPDETEGISCRKAGGNFALLYADGNNMTVARYPNEEYATVREGSLINSAKGWEWAELNKDTVFLYFDREHLGTVKFWHDWDDIYSFARYNSISYADDGRIFGFDRLKGSLEVLFTQRVQPKVGMPFYWYNVIEEIDMPGEYYIDKDCILYYYPTDDFDGATFSLAKLDCDLIDLDGAEYLTFENLTLTGTRRNAVKGEGSGIVFDGCTVSEVATDGISIIGENNTVRNCELYGIGETAVELDSGDFVSLERNNNTVSNNKIHSWALGVGIDTPAIFVRGCGATVSHNECVHSGDAAIRYEGPYHTVEYNYCADACRFAGDCGVIGSKELFCDGTVIRYNYVTDCGFTRDTEIDSVGVTGISLGNGQEGVKVYGNVVDNIMGDGIGIYGGRDNEVYGNIIKSCKYGVHYDGCFIIQAYNVDPVGCNRVNTNDYFRNSDWQAAFPYIKNYTYYSYGMDYDGECLISYDFNAAPVSKIYSNVYYLDKVVCERADNPYYIDKYVKTYSGESIEIPSVKNGTLYSYSSKRTEYKIEDCIAENQGKIAITPEQFGEIGLAK